MNKYIYILGLVGTALLSACSADDLTMIPSSEEEESIVVEAGKDSDIPITLGVSSSRGLTRAVVNPDADGNFETETGKYLGVFCLATGYQSPYEAEEMRPIENDWTKDNGTCLLVRMNNVPAKVEGGNVAFMNLNATSEQNYYYPMGNWMKYNFYAYYPRQEETVGGKTTLAITANQVLEKYYEIDGSQDIIWGMAVPPADDAFSAKYFRENVSAVIPQFSFYHKLVLFRFFVKAENTDVVNWGTQITDMYISNAIYRLSLIVANKADASKNGQLSMMSSLQTKELGIKESGLDKNRFRDEDANDIVDSPLSITVVDPDVTSATPVGYILLAPPSVSNDDNFEYTLVLKVNYDKGEGPTAKTLEYTLNPPSGGFTEGKVYNIVVSVNPEL